jgi:predicted enzyme related to lactoylglutathione lyase
MDATETLTRFADAISTSDWDALTELLAPGFTARLVHTGETFDRDGFVAFNRDYPGPWTFVTEEVVGAGRSGVLRARVATGAVTYYVASFATLDDAGAIAGLVEVWTDGVAADGGLPHHHHGIDYVEIGVADVAAAKTFYGAAFGWEFNDYGPDYAGIRAPAGRGEVGGLNPGRPAVPGGPLVLLFSDDLDATVSAVQAAGGTVTEGPYEFPGGRRFHFTDPSGTELGVWATS